MKILLLEDRSLCFEPIIEIAKHCNHVVVHCCDTCEADKAIKKHKKFDLYIIDLKIDENGLSPSQKKRTAVGYYSGWIWLYDEVLKKKPENAPVCILLTGIMDSFINNYLETAESDEKSMALGVKMIDKSSKWKDEIEVILKNL